MRPEELRALTASRVVLLDGGLGSMLIAAGLEPGRAPETWVLAHPDRLASVHRAYAEAGSDIVHTCTFGASPPKLAAAGLGMSCRDVNAAAVALAREAVKGVCDRTVLLAGDVGPTGMHLPPVGATSESELAAAFRKQVEALAAAGVDLISIETMYDLREALIAVRAARETGLAVIASLTVESRKRGFFTIMGDPLIPSLCALAEAGADAVGCNCSVTADAMRAMIAQATGTVAVPLAAQPNAGQPRATAAGVTYDADPEHFARDLLAIARAGARLVGGCCGTTPAFIRAARAALDPAGGSP